MRALWHESQALSLYLRPTNGRTALEPPYSTALFCPLYPSRARATGQRPFIGPADPLIGKLEYAPSGPWAALGGWSWPPGGGGGHGMRKRASKTPTRRRLFFIQPSLRRCFYSPDVVKVADLTRLAPGTIDSIQTYVINSSKVCFLRRR